MYRQLELAAEAASFALAECRGVKGVMFQWFRGADETSSAPEPWPSPPMALLEA